MVRTKSRPIAAQHSHTLKELSRRLAEALHAEVNKYGAIAKDSKSVVQKLERFKPRRKGVFVTYDVEALYPSIDIDDACKVLSSNVPALRSQNGFWASALAFVMRNNYGTDHRDTCAWASVPSSAPTGTRLMTKYNRPLQRQWLSLQQKHNIRNRLIAKRLGSFNKDQQSLLEDWPGTLVLQSFPKLIRAVVSARHTCTILGKRPTPDGAQLGKRQAPEQQASVQRAQKATAQCRQATLNFGSKSDQQTDLTNKKNPREADGTKRLRIADAAP